MIFFFYGPNTFSAWEKISQLKEKFIKEIDASGNSLSEIDAEQISPKDLSQLSQTSSLFAKKRMLIIKNILQNKQTQTIELASKILENNRDNGDIIIFQEKEIEKAKIKGKTKELFDTLAKEKYAQEFSNLSGQKLIDWAEKKISAKNIKISRPALSRLCELENDPWRLHGTINQLSNLCQEKGEIRTDDIEIFLEEKHLGDIFKLTEAMGSHKKEESLKLLEEQILSGLAEEYVLAMTFKHFENLTKIKLCRVNGSDPSSLGLHPFVIKKGLLQADKFSESQLKSLLKRIVGIEKRAKTGRGDIRAELGLLITEL